MLLVSSSGDMSLKYGMSLYVFAMLVSTQDSSKGIRKSKSENFGRRPRSSAEGQGWFPMATVDSWMGLEPWALGLLNDVKGNTFSHFPCILKGNREVEVSRIG